MTLFLAKMWGPIMLALGIGMFTSRAYYVRLYRDLQKETLGLLIFAMFGTAAGIAQVSVHNVWDTFAQVVISLLGWGMLLKGIVFALAPNLVDRMGDWQAKKNLIPYAGTVLVILGAYLCWFAYVA